MNKQKTIIILVIIITLGIAGFSIYRYKQEQQSAPTHVLTDFPNATRFIDEEDAQELVDNLNNEISFLGKEGFNDFGLWLNIGAYKKALGDYRGAEEAWNNALLLNSDNPVPYGNLGDLYLYFLNQPDTAVENLERAIGLNPDNYNYNSDLASVYRYKKPDEIDRVEGIILEGVKAEPSLELNYYLYLLDFYDKEGDDILKMRQYAEKIRNLNPGQEVLDVVDSFLAQKENA